MIRLLILLLSLFALSAHAGILFNGDFESGVVDNSGDLGPDRFWYGALGPNCQHTTTYSTANDNRLITSGTRGSWSQYAAAMTIRYNCDYRIFNGGTAANLSTGLQKPRQELGVPESLFKLNTNVVYKIAFSVKVPSDYVYDTSTQDYQMFETFKLNNRNATATGAAQTNGGGAFYLNVVGDKLRWVTNNPHTGSTLDYSTAARYEEFPLVKGQWHDFLIDTRLCNVGQAGCSGYVKLYKDGVLIREWTGANTTSTAGHKIKWSLYKHAWHCQINGPGYTGSYSNAQQDYAFCMTNPHTTNSTAPITTYVDEIKVGDAASTYAELQPWRFDGGYTPPTGSDPKLIRTNQDQPIPENKPTSISEQPVYFTTECGTNGILNASITDGTNTVLAAAFNGDDCGGRLNFDSFSTLVGTSATLQVVYDKANLVLDTEGAQSFDTWSPDGMSVTALTPTPTSADLLANYGFTKPYEFANTSAAYKSVNSPLISNVTTGENITFLCSFRQDGTTTNRLRFRLVEKVGAAQQYNTFAGAYGSISQTANVFGSGGSFTQWDDNGIFQVQYSINATAATADYFATIGADSNALNAKIRPLGCRAWKNKSPKTMTLPVLLDRPDTVAPNPGPCTLNKVSGAASFQCELDDNTGTFCASIYETDIAPAPATVKAGTGSLWYHCGTVTGYSYGETTPLLDVQKDWHFYAVHSDLVPNDSTVVTADNYITAEPIILKKLKLGTPTNKIKTLNAFGKMVDSNDTIDRVYVYGSDITATTGAVDPLVTLQNVVLTSGIGEASEANVVPGSGSLNALSDGSYWVLSVEGTGSNMKISYGQKSVVTE